MIIMTNYETLKIICDIIWYTPKFEYQEYDEREIIFSPEFMEKFVKYYDNKTLLWPKRIYEQLWLTLLNWNLHDPTSYLANLLGIWTEKN